MQHKDMSTHEQLQTDDVFLSITGALVDKRTPPVSGYLALLGATRSIATAHLTVVYTYLFIIVCFYFVNDLGVFTARSTPNVQGL